MGKFTRFMDSQHDEVHGLFKRFREMRKKDFEKSKQLFSEFKSLLEKHLMSEEKVLFPYVEETLGDKNFNAVLKREHQEMRRLVNDIDAKFAGGTTQTDEEEKLLEALLSSHSLKESGTIYQLIDKLPDKKDLGA